MNCEAVQPFHIGQTAEALGVTSRYIRKLEAGGLVPRARRDDRGFRVYSKADIEMLRALGIGSKPRRLKRVEEVVGA